VPASQSIGPACRAKREREFLIDILLVRIHFIIEMVWRTKREQLNAALPARGGATPAAGGCEHPNRLCTQNERFCTHDQVMSTSIPRRGGTRAKREQLKTFSRLLPDFYPKGLGLGLGEHGATRFVLAWFCCSRQLHALSLSLSFCL